MIELQPRLSTRTASGIPVRATSEPSLVPVVTLVIWLGCAAVGVLGFVLPYARAQWQKKSELPPVVAQLINVELKQEPVRVAPAPINLLKPLDVPPAAPQVVAPPATAPLAVAEPTPQIAFAVPIEAPAPIVSASEASFRTPEVAPPPAAPVEPTPEPLTFGQGAGKQPAPEYPRQALRDGQEGTVVVRFTVGENGRVLVAEAAAPSPWSLLNNAAVRAVRERWRFPAGPVRAYEVPIHFQIKR